MSTKKDCSFQYATASSGYITNGKIIEDTDLITLEEAKELWNKYLPDFKERMANGERPELCIWTDMEQAGEYRHDTYHIHADDLELVDGKLYEIKKKQIGEL